MQACSGTGRLCRLELHRAARVGMIGLSQAGVGGSEWSRAAKPCNLCTVQ
jgi:hypothetical protein